MNNVVICGVDSHDNSLVCRICVGTGEPSTSRYGNSAKGRECLFGALRDLGVQQGCGRIVMAYEASTHGFCLYDHCREAGIECFVLAPTKMRKSRKDRKRKNDEHDAQMIVETLRAHVLAGNELPSIWIPDDQTRADRETVRARLDLGHKLTGAKTQVQTLLKSHRLTKPESAGKSWTKPYRQWLASLCEGGCWTALSTLLRQIAFLEEEIAIVDKEVARLSKTDRYAEASGALEELMGVGLLTAMVFLTEMGDLGRFANRKKVGAFLGLVPSSDESGEKNDRKGHITREGSARVRRVLCQAAWARIAHDEEARAAYDRIAERNRKHKKIAVVASMRRLAIRMWHVGLDAQRRAGVFTAADGAHAETTTA